MKIAIVGNITKPVIDGAKGGTEAFTNLLVNSLVKKNHEVFLYATSDSKTSAKLISNVSSKEVQGVKEGGIEIRIPYSLLQSLEILKDSNKFEIIHNNYFDSFLLPIPFEYSVPVVTTVHNDFWQFPHMRFVLAKMMRSNRDFMVFVSKSARKLANDPEQSTFIHNGVSTSLYEYKPDNAQDRLLWLSRFIPKKGADLAIQVSKKTGKSLTLAGYYPYMSTYEDYYNKKIKPELSKDIKTIDPSLSEKISLYQSSKVFLFPIQWEEPFGLVVAEAMSCGTPVISYARGAMQEIIEDGKTGFLVNSSDENIKGDFIIKKTGIEGLTEAVNRLYSLSSVEYKQMRLASRKRVEENFTVERMVDSYEKLYKELISR